MMELRLVRFAYSPVGTFGSMRMPDGEQIYTVEDPWRNNRPNVSCIPAGDYPCVPRRYNRGGYDAIHITNVENRSHILFHRGNTELDVEGCIVTGMKLGFIDGRWAVSESRGAFDVLMHHYGEKEFQLIIEDYDPAADGYETMRSATASQTLSAEYLHRFGVLLEANDNAGFEFIADQQTHAKRSVIEQCVIGMYQARVENDIAACTAHFASQAHIALLGENKNIYQTNESATMNVADQIKLLVDIWSWQEVANQRLVIDGSNVAAFYELTTVFNPTGETITTYISDHMRVNDQGEITEFIEFVDTALVARLASGIE